MTDIENIKKASGFTIKEIRKHAGISIEELGYNLNIRCNELKEYENGNKLPDISFYLNLAEVCLVDPEDILLQLIGEVRMSEDGIWSVRIS